ncbi:hypothetical protein P3T36_002993 [Kitasatospora sp. MAP12-15]|nr:hypothetical protein [Kitasatospora sp. MAP12-44]
MKLVEDKGLRGAMAELYDEIPTVKSSTFDFSGDAYPDILGFMVTGVLGDLTTTGAAAPYSHAASLYNANDGQPPSYTLTDFYAVNTRQYPGSKFSDLEIKFNADGLITYSAKAVGLASIPTTAPTPSFTSVQPLAAWTGAVQIGGSPFHALMDGSISIKRSVAIIPTVDGSQSPHALWSGPVTVSGKMTLVMEDESQLTNFLTTATTSLDFTFQAGTGASLVSLKLHMSSVIYGQADISRGKEYVEIGVTFNAKANATDVGASGGYSPIKVTLQNSVVAGTYK